MDGRLPDGVVTFLFTDVEGSANLWEEAPDSMMEALKQHDRIIDYALETRNGVLVKPRGEGDSRFIVFRTAAEAVDATPEIQQNLADADWQLPRQLKVRASLHIGAADLQLGDYYGPAVNRASYWSRFASCSLACATITTASLASSAGMASLIVERA